MSILHLSQNTLSENILNEIDVIQQIILNRSGIYLDQHDEKEREEIAFWIISHEILSGNYELLKELPPIFETALIRSLLESEHIHQDKLDDFRSYLESLNYGVD